jgi:hypothetical protein
MPLGDINTQMSLGVKFIKIETMKNFSTRADD